jgi:hypothetical protein
MDATNKLALVLLTYYAAFLLSCSTCEDKVKVRVPAGDGQIVATVFERNCGATTDLSTLVNLQTTSSRFDANAGRLFIIKGRYDITLNWATPKHLVITCRGCQRHDIFREVAVEGDIDVTYDFSSSAN